MKIKMAQTQSDKQTNRDEADNETIHANTRRHIIKREPSTGSKRDQLLTLLRETKAALAC